MRCSALTLAIAAGLVTAGCEAPVALPQVSFSATDFKISGPDTIAGGLTGLHFSTSGHEPHQMQLVKLKDGVSFPAADSTVQATIAVAAKEGPAVFAHLYQIANGLYGGGPAMDPGMARDVVLDIPGGNYMLFCFLSGADGIPHFAKGMTRHLVVLPAAARQPTPPVADMSVNLTDFAFDSFPALKAGKTVLEVRNRGTEPHELALIRLKGITAQQFVQMASAPPPPPPAPAKGARGKAAPPPAAAPQGPPPFEFVGGMQAINPGSRAWASLDLTPGDYIAVCFVPSPGHDYKAHIEMGMMKPFKI